MLPGEVVLEVGEGVRGEKFPHDAPVLSRSEANLDVSVQGRPVFGVADDAFLHATKVSWPLADRPRIRGNSNCGEGEWSTRRAPPIATVKTVVTADRPGLNKCREARRRMIQESSGKLLVGELRHQWTRAATL